MDFARYPSLAGRVVFISGGGSGIGASLVEHFAAQGARVGFVDIQEEASHALVDRLAAGAQHAPVFLKADVTDIPAYQAAIREIGARLGPITVLINNAARDDRHTLESVTPEYWDRCVAINMRHQFFAVQAVVEQMAGAGGGSIITFGSISWMRKIGGMVGYTTSKSAINGLTRTLARELGPRNIRVNCIVPGAIVTERQMKLWSTPESEKAMIENQCLKFRLEPAEIARMALFLAADDSRGCTAANFVVDAGLS